MKCAKCGAEEDDEAKRQVAAVSGDALQIRRAPDGTQGAGAEEEQGEHQIPPEVLELLQLKRSHGGKSSEPIPNVQSYLSSSRGHGEELSKDVRADLEPRFGADFSQVRVHTDGTAAQVSRALGAHAFAYGRDIYFGAGQYNPSSAGGRWLLAHELTHTIQQTGARPRAVQAHLAMGHVNDPYEQEADRMADMVTTMAAPAQTQAAPAAAAGGPEVARKADGGALETHTPEVMTALLLQKHAATLLTEVGLSSPEQIQGHLFGGDCIAEYWNLAAAIASLVAAAGAGLALILAPDPTTITKWAAVGAIAGVIAGLAWTINSIISLVNCKRALPQTAAREQEIRDLQDRQRRLEETLRRLQGQQNQPPGPGQQQPGGNPN
ncbi:MAG: DUF4157 domain-containing protein [Deltaproteobacteria bacterium]|nr:DUF4157 domain-containing protein [Deltaproteobacteria bacterium]